MSHKTSRDRKTSRNNKTSRKLCADCGHRPAKYRRLNGKYSFRIDHDLCPGCYGRQRDRDRAANLGGRQ
ncbi:hypothetical protein N9917_00120 [Deltaproteobacteria bacterium]|nr:hypothetical protein [Deltaproteobacteria bacterium]